LRGITSARDYINPQRKIYGGAAQSGTDCVTTAPSCAKEQRCEARLPTRPPDYHREMSGVGMSDLYQGSAEF